MTEPAYDLLIRGGRVATVSDVFEADVAISGETIAAIGRGLPGARQLVQSICLRSWTILAATRGYGRHRPCRDGAACSS